MATTSSHADERAFDPMHKVAVFYTVIRAGRGVEGTQSKQTRFPAGSPDAGLARCLEGRPLGRQTSLPANASPLTSAAGAVCWRHEGLCVAALFHSAILKTCRMRGHVLQNHLYDVERTKLCTSLHIQQIDTRLVRHLVTVFVISTN